MADGRDDPTLSDARIDAAPEPIKALFRDYEFWPVVQALEAIGLNGPPERWAPAWITEGAAQARKLLEAEARKRQEELLRGP
jgi:hypothetical protein